MLKDQSSNSEDTICALATAPGGALGIIRISGSQAFSAVTSRGKKYGEQFA